MKTIAPSVNYHLTKSCNMRCKFCYATFNDIGAVKHEVEKSEKIIDQLASYGFEKITFAGGEPTLINELPELVRYAKSLGLTTCVVTNGSRLCDSTYFAALTRHLDWMALSIDSVSNETNQLSGRAMHKQTVLTREYYLDVIKKIHCAGIQLKVNTVVSAFNQHEDLTDFIREASPRRWKILQATPVDGQNSAHFGKFEINTEAYLGFLQRHNELHSSTIIVEESTELIRGSYVMVSPDGRFFDETKGKHTYSSPILEVGVEAALKQVTFFPDKFEKRKGLYDWSKKTI